MESSATESKPFQSCSKYEIHGWTRLKEPLSRSKLKQAFLTDSDAELFMYSIQCIRFGSRKVLRLNQASDPSTVYFQLLTLPSWGKSINNTGNSAPGTPWIP